MNEVWYSKVEYFVVSKKTDKRSFKSTYELVTKANPTKQELISLLERKINVGANNVIKSARVLDHIELGKADGKRMYSGFVVNVFGK